MVPFLKEHGDRVVLLLAPLRGGGAGRAGVVALREAITRNHRCQSLGELVDLVISWLAERKAFRVRDSVYETAQAA